MKTHIVRSLLAALSVFFAGTPALLAAEPAPIRVLVWDEQQPAQKQAYENFLGNQIAGYLQDKPGLAVRSVRLDDPDQGLAPDALDNCDVLIWWGHIRHREIKPERGQQIVERIKSGRLSLIALHSAHWSTPFVEAMNERAKSDALLALAPEERASAVFELIPGNVGSLPQYDAPLSPSVQYRKPPEGPVTIKLRLPNCCFPAYRPDGKPSFVRVLAAEHPIAAGIPKTFQVDQTEMYDEPFHVPPPDEVVLEERWADGTWFRSGSVWRIGQGRIFYFRPGHETFGVFKNPTVLKILENAVRWLPTADKAPADKAPS